MWARDPGLKTLSLIFEYSAPAVSECRVRSLKLRVLGGFTVSSKENHGSNRFWSLLSTSARSSCSFLRRSRHLSRSNMNPVRSCSSMMKATSCSSSMARGSVFFDSIRAKSLVVTSTSLSQYSCISGDHLSHFVVSPKSPLRSPKRTPQALRECRPRRLPFKVPARHRPSSSPKRSVQIRRDMTRVSNAFERSMVNHGYSFWMAGMSKLMMLWPIIMSAFIRRSAMVSFTSRV